MMSRAAAELVAKVMGRPFPSPLRQIDLALMKAGLSRSERRKLMAAAFGKHDDKSLPDKRTGQ